MKIYIIQSYIIKGIDFYILIERFETKKVVYFCGLKFYFKRYGKVSDIIKKHWEMLTK